MSKKYRCVRILGICVLFLFLIIESKAQLQVKGQVVSDNGTPIEAVNILLRSISDSTLLEVAVSDSLGYYVLACPELPFFVSYSCIGFKSISINYDSTLKAYRRVVLEESPEILDEVVIVARSIKTTPVIGGIECTIRNKTIIKDRSVADFLSYAPLVATSGLQSFRVADKEHVVFYINGRRSHMSPAALYNYLRSLSADQVSSLKILHQPPLEYGVGDDYAVIDIVVKDDNVGFQGSLRGEVIKTRYWKQTSSATFLFQTPRWRTQMYLSARNLKDYERGESYTRYTSTQQYVENEQQRDTRRKQYDFNLTSEYQLLTDHLIGASVDMYNYDGTPNTSIKTHYRTNVIDSVFMGTIARKYTDRYLAGALYYKGKLRGGISFSAELTGLWSDYQHRMSHKYRREDLSNSPLYLDYTADLPMKTHSYEAKIKAMVPLMSPLSLHVGSQTDYRKAFYKEKYNIVQSPKSYFLTDQKLEYNETSLLLYALFSCNFPASITSYGGFYGQYNKTAGAFNEERHSTYNNRWYLLPYLNITWNSNGLSVAYSFSASNYYHNFISYSPFKQWQSITTYSQGNPELRPVRSLHHTLTARYKNLNVKLFHSRSDDATLIIPVLEDKTVIAYRSYNYGKSFSWGLSLGYGVDVTPWWYFNGNANVRNSTLKAELPIVELYAPLYDNAWFVSGGVSNAFTLSERYDWTADLSISYSAPYRWGYTIENGMMQCNFNMRKSIGDNIMLALWCYKSWLHSLGYPLHRWGISETHSSHFQTLNKSWGEDMGIALSLTYFFGKSSLNQRVERHSTDASRIISNNK
ncbi:Uncharacterised protein [Porphyromonas macacae]|uniref:Outer membrane protein beta-barrel domain-containing protein n=2 Tax=Porphyromonas macacae TaxID=28115 RepID=A0A379E7A8_9PORP|nr:outer membrane beta-barrel protein [Porphyromonas macacae]SUB88575.1 Uncharacterised protein [Porphyromonas macacae]